MSTLTRHTGQQTNPTALQPPLRYLWSTIRLPLSLLLSRLNNPMGQVQLVFTGLVPLNSRRQRQPHGEQLNKEHIKNTNSGSTAGLGDAKREEMQK